MDIVTRLKKFLDDTGISNSQFADTCVIPRPTLSQLLNGRNKKVSDEVIAKIHRAYPTLNIMWLMFGDGEMLLNASDGSHQDDDSTTESMMSDGHIDEMGQRAISFDDEEPGAYRRSSKSSSQRVAIPPSMSETIESIVRSTAAGRGNQRGVNGGERRVVKMLVFYSDGRFDEFEPRLKE